MGSAHNSVPYLKALIDPAAHRDRVPHAHHLSAATGGSCGKLVPANKGLELTRHATSVAWTSSSLRRAGQPSVVVRLMEDARL